MILLTIRSIHIQTKIICILNYKFNLTNALKLVILIERKCIHKIDLENVQIVYLRKFLEIDFI